MSSLTGISPKNPTDYRGPSVYLSSIVTRSRAPTSADVLQPETGKKYPLASYWLVGKNPTTGTQGDLWYLSKIVSNVATWKLVASGSSGPVLISHVDTFTAPATTADVVPDGIGKITITGKQIANANLANALRTNSYADNQYTVEIQRTTTNATTDTTKNGIAHFNSVQFSADSNGFVTLKGSGPAATSFVTDSGTATPNSSGVLNVKGQATPNVSGVRFTSAGTNEIDGTMFSPFAGNFSFTTVGSGIPAGTFIALQVVNQDNTVGTSDAILQAGVGGASSGDAYVQTGVQALGIFCAGVKNNDGDAYYISFGNTLSSGVNYLRIDPSGYVNMPLQPCFNATPSAQIANVTGDATVYGPIVFNTELFDQGSNYNNGNGIFTAPRGGKYRFSGMVVIQGIDATYTSCNLQLITTTRTYDLAFLAPGKVFDSNTNVSLPFSVITDMAATNTASVFITVSGGAKTVSIAGNGSALLFSYFCGELVV